MDSAPTDPDAGTTDSDAGATGGPTNPDASTTDPDAGGGATGGAVSVGLVLSGGGAAAEAWHAGVVRALHAATGWDARRADLILGTSAGAITGLCLRAGIPPADLYAHRRGEPVSEEGRAIIDRVVTPYTEGRRQRDWTEQGPQSPSLAARALWPPWQPRPLHAAVGLLPRGARTTEALAQRMAELHPEQWPARPFWVTAVRLSDGERVVFGRDDQQATAAEAVRASCAVPTLFEPVTVDGQRYVDGGVHSYTNADLMGPPAFDLVVVSSPISGQAGWAKVRGSLSEAWTRVRDGLQPDDSRTGGSERSEAGHEDSRAGPDRAWWSEALDLAWSDGRALWAARRQWVDDKLREEVEGLRRRGIAVLVAEPDPDGVELVDTGRDAETATEAEADRTDHAEEPADGDHAEEAADRDNPARGWRAEVAGAADQTVHRLLADRGGSRLAAMLRQAAR